jgi:phospholipid/cholesterol/gamma-HCH transport system ATP-binding protein
MNEPHATDPAPNDTEPIVALDKVSMRFGEHSVLRHVEIRVPRGKTLAIIGESGCGKTVLLKLVVGLIHPTAGVVRFEGKNLRELRESQLIALRLRMGFLFQGAALFDSLNVFDNVSFGLRAKDSRKSGCPPTSSRRCRPSCRGE